MAACISHNGSEEFIDFDLAKRLQEEYDRETAANLQDDNASKSSENERKESGSRSTSSLCSSDLSPVDPSLELSDPSPNIRELFLQYNERFFWGKLLGIEVKWSPRMTLCAGLCVYEGRGGLCSVRLSQPLLKLRPRKDTAETLLHEMIHALLFITDNNTDHDGHGPQFQSHMKRINAATGANISIYHTFHDEVAVYKTHWWRCGGPCRERHPYFGWVKRAMNRAPSFRDTWWKDHEARCGGAYVKVKEPEGYGQKKAGKGKGKEDSQKEKGKDIREFLGKGKTLGSNLASKSSGKPSGLFSSIGSSNDKSDGTSSGNKAVIVNGVLKRVDNSSASIDVGKKQLTLPDLVSSQPGASGSHSCWSEDDDDDSWVFKADQSKQPKQRNMPHSNKSSSLSDDIVDLTQNETGNVKGQRKGKYGVNNKGKGKNARHKTFVSVCEDKDEKRSLKERFESPAFKRPKRKKQYIFDDLDSNDGLWENSRSPKKSVKIPLDKDRLGSIKKELPKQTSQSNENLTIQEILRKKYEQQKQINGSTSGMKNIKQLHGSNSNENLVKKDSDTDLNLPKFTDIQKVEKSIGWSQQNSPKRQFSGKGFTLGGATSSGPSYLSEIRKTFDVIHPVKKIYAKEKTKSTFDDSTLASSSQSYHHNKRKSHEAFESSSSDDSGASHFNSSKKSRALGNSAQPSSSVSGNLFRSDVPSLLTGGTGRPVTQDKDLHNVPCPVCGVNIPEKEINSHLDECQLDTQDNDLQGVPCPICGAHISENEINAHLDECLEG